MLIGTKLKIFKKVLKKVGKKFDKAAAAAGQTIGKGAQAATNTANKAGNAISQSIKNAKAKHDANKTAKANAKAAKEQEKANATTAENKRHADYSKALHEGAMASDVKDYKSSNTVKSFTDFMADRGYSDSEISKARGMLSWNPYTLDSFIKQKSREDWLLNPEDYI